MGLFRLIFYGFLIYIGFKILAQIFNKITGEIQVKGKPKHRKLDIDQTKIEDADFEELDEK